MTKKYFVQRGFLIRLQSFFNCVQFFLERRRNEKERESSVLDSTYVVSHRHTGNRSI
jgi:hypothetical protein